MVRAFVKKLNLFISRFTCTVWHDICPRGGIGWLAFAFSNSQMIYLLAHRPQCSACASAFLCPVYHPPLAFSISGHDNWSCYHKILSP